MTPAGLLCVVGVGRPVGDDAVGWEVVRQLRASVGPTPGVQFHLLDGGQLLLDVLDGAGALWLVDAVQSGAAPGALHRFAWPDACLDGLRAGSTHDLRPAQALQLAAALGMLPAEVTVFGVEIGSLDPGAGLSAAAAAAVPALARRMADEMQPWLRPME